MSTTEVTAIPGNTDHIVVEEILLDRIQPSKANPRRRLDNLAMTELAANIKARGVLQPILVRPMNSNGFEIVCGERRWRASRVAGLHNIPARIVNLTDAEALELAVIENVQRENIHELDEAIGYQALMRQDPALYTVETIAAKVGRSPKYIYGRLKLAELTPNLQKAFYEGKLTAGHAMEIARLQPKDQERALSECFPGHRTTAAILKDKDPRPISARELRDWIQREIHLSLANAPFDVNDANLVPAAGACTACPKRSGSNPLLFADTIKRPDVCTDPECFKQKRDALVAIRISELESSGEKPVKVSDSHLFYGQKALPDVIYRADYHDATAGDCPTTVAAVVVEGKRIGAKLHICNDPKCKIHLDHRTTLSAEEKAERKIQAQAVRIQQEYRKRLLEEVRKRVPSEFSRYEFEFVALRYFHQSGHDSQHRIIKFFAWDTVKAKNGSGGYLDYPKLAGAKLGAMTTADIGRFLVVCALASDLYCPTNMSSATLAKDSNLATAVRHYKVKGDQILREVRDKFMNKQLPHNDNFRIRTIAKR
ncbi:MAG TPA: ParB/RepB/Spo0J family partition protein [Terriglobia bacterium]|nr:ParB/RepB/Spo0J family partition protein [Terriglobia bacterium]